ncbi:MAG TPA: I78 family peptidase inhibitor [Allosphingosinicella sp.]|nr:I78 family peptidase inhibitor [Allosphingosinicella sp.]
MRTLILAALLATGCATAPPAEAVGGGKCDSAKAQGLIGRSRSGAVGDEALRLTGATALRWIAPGAMVTMDYREDRVNLRVDPAGKVVKVDCG